MTTIDGLAPNELLQLALTLPLAQVTTLAKQSPELQRLYRTEIFWEKRVQKDFPSYVPSSLPISYKQYYDMLSKVWNFYPLERNQAYQGPYLIEPIDLKLQYKNKMAFLYPVPIFPLEQNKWFGDILVNIQQDGIIITTIPRLSLLGPIPDVTDLVPKLDPKRLPALFQRVYESLHRSYASRKGVTFCLDHQHWSLFLAKIKNMDYVRFIGADCGVFEQLTLLEMLEDHELFHDPKIGEEDFAQAVILSNYSLYVPAQAGADFSYQNYGELLAETQLLTNKLGEALLEPITIEEGILGKDLALVYPVPLFDIKRGRRWVADIYIQPQGIYYLIGFRERQTMIGAIPAIESFATNWVPVRDKHSILLDYDLAFIVEADDYLSFLVGAQGQGYYIFNTGDEQEPFVYLPDLMEIKGHRSLFNLQR